MWVLVDYDCSFLQQINTNMATTFYNLISCTPLSPWILWLGVLKFLPSVLIFSNAWLQQLHSTYFAYTFWDSGCYREGNFRQLNIPYLRFTFGFNFRVAQYARSARVNYKIQRMIGHLTDQVTKWTDISKKMASHVHQCVYFFSELLEVTRWLTPTTCYSCWLWCVTTTACNTW